MPVQVGERSAESQADELFIRDGGGEDDECVIPTVPLAKLAKPGDL
jgi:hypothetical protein